MGIGLVVVGVIVPLAATLGRRKRYDEEPVTADAK